MAALAHAPAPPAGLVEVQTFPDWSTATHSDADGQEIPLSGLAVIAATDHRAVGVAGVVVVSTSPIRSTAAQNDADGHEIPVSPLRPSVLPSMSVVVHVDGPAGGVRRAHEIAAAVDGQAQPGARTRDRVQGRRAARVDLDRRIPADGVGLRGGG